MARHRPDLLEDAHDPDRGPGEKEGYASNLDFPNYKYDLVMNDAASIRG
jgi:hypothetical protein